MGTTVIPSTDKLGLGRAKPLHDINGAAGLGDIRWRADKNKVIAHDLTPMSAAAFECTRTASTSLASPNRNA